MLVKVIIDISKLPRCWALKQLHTLGEIAASPVHTYPSSLSLFLSLLAPDLSVAGWGPGCGPLLLLTPFTAHTLIPHSLLPLEQCMPLWPSRGPSVLPTALLEEKRDISSLKGRSYTSTQWGCSTIWTPNYINIQTDVKNCKMTLTLHYLGNTQCLW